MVRPLGLASSVHNAVCQVKLIAPTENSSKTLPRHLPQIPRSVQSGFSHRLRDGKNHIYYGFCVLCGVIVFVRPAFSSVVGLFESSVNVLMTVLVLYMPYIRFISETDDILTADMPEVAGVAAPQMLNLLMACGIAVISFRGCIHELTMGRDQP